MEQIPEAMSARPLSIYARFLSGQILSKMALAAEYNVTERSIQRDNEHFRLPYRNCFEKGEFRKRVQFMFGGELQTIRFWYTGPSLKAVLDRLPTVQVIQGSKDGWTISA